MYIAFKWLTSLALAMWSVMCIIDFYVKNSKEIQKRGLRTETSEWIYKNITLQVDQKLDIHDIIDERKFYETNYRRFDLAVLHYLMFFAGAVAVSVFNKKKEIMIYTKNTFSKIDIHAAINASNVCLKNTATIFYVATCKYCIKSWVIILSKINNIKNGIKMNVTEKHKRLNIILVKKIKEMSEERRKLGQLLITAIHENKNIRTQFQLESMAKNRLVRHIEETQKNSKENRLKYISFQHLYLVTHQENVFLKARIRKLTNEKENAEKDLMKIINEVYRSKNNDLKSFCSRFIVRPQDNLLKSNVCAEVQKFLQKSCFPPEATTSWHVSSRPEKEVRCANARVTEILSVDDSVVPFVSDAPKLRGLPGECIWTVKDKDGIIEKLYEYDCESDIDNGDTIRSIREYSVYYDKDCLLDFSRSRTLIAEPIPLSVRTLYPTNEKFLTGSEAFKKFLQNNKNIVPSSKSHLPPLP